MEQTLPWVEPLWAFIRFLIIPAGLWFVWDYLKFKESIRAELTEQRRDHDIKVAQIMAKVAMLDKQCIAHSIRLDELNKTTKATARNVVRIAAKLDVSDLEKPD